MLIPRPHIRCAGALPGLALLLILSLGAATARGQSQPAEGSTSAPGVVTDPGGGSPSSGDGAFYDSVDVRLVNVEVTVTDADGQPVTGLGRGDFVVLEDGAEVEISHFSAVADGVVSGGGAPPTRGLRLVVFLDSPNLAGRGRQRLLAELRRSLPEALGESDEVMVVNRREGLDVVLPFSRDRAALAAALEDLGRELPPAGINSKEQILRQIYTTRLGDLQGEAAQQADSLLAAIRNDVTRTQGRLQESLSALQRFTSSLAGLPGRKAVLYLSDGLPSRPGAALIQAWRDKFEARMSTQGELRLRTETGSIRNLQPDLTPWFRRLAEHSAAQGVALYAVADIDRRRSRGSAEVGGGGTSGVTVSPEVAVVDAFSLESSLLALADGTGGRASTRGRGVESLLGDIVNDFNHFYSLGYRPSREGDEELHSLEVRARDPSWRVRYGRAYRDASRLDRLENLALSALYYGVAENPLEARIDTGTHQETVDGAYRIPVLVKIPSESLAFLPGEDGRSSRVLAVVVAQDEKRDISLFQRIFLPIQMQAPIEAQAQDLESQGQVVLVAYRVDVVMRPGDHRLSVALRDEIAGVESAFYLDVNVGDGRRRDAGPTASTSSTVDSHGE
ncbi:MAG: VWA domain-containing protein [Acidobacteriota bacterium]